VQFGVSIQCPDGNVDAALLAVSPAALGASQTLMSDLSNAGIGVVTGARVTLSPIIGAHRFCFPVDVRQLMRLCTKVFACLDRLTRIPTARRHRSHAAATATRRAAAAHLTSAEPAGPQHAARRPG
jgi:hypothetical protein